ncbi:MAG: 4,5-dioxygenase [Deltaproteobacteria bacterium]|nr:4,5-dioxygenase [Deltaproteobacteria bacterium]
MNSTTSQTIHGFHVHVYFDPPTRVTALDVRDGLAERFDVELGRIHDRAMGPHPKSMYQVKFAPDEFSALIQWLMLNHAGLDVLIHPETGDDIADHTVNALWLGEKLALNIEFLRKFVAKTQEGKAA